DARVMCADLPLEMAMLPRPADDPDEEFEAEPLVRSVGTPASLPAVIPERAPDDPEQADGQWRLCDDHQIRAPDAATERWQRHVATIHDPGLGRDRRVMQRFEPLRPARLPIACPVQLIEMHDGQPERQAERDRRRGLAGTGPPDD